MRDAGSPHGPIVLGVDTAAPTVGLALVGGGFDEVRTQRIVRGADAWLGPQLAELLSMLDAAGSSLSAVAVSTGPGAFTGLRVGVSSALGLAVARNVPVVPGSSLRSRAAGAPNGRVLALLDARKQRVYAGWFEVDGESVKAIGPEVDEPLEQVLSGAPTHFHAVGEGAHVHAAALSLRGGVLCESAHPAHALARWSRERLHEAVDPGAIALRYLRPPDARPSGKGRVLPRR